MWSYLVIIQVERWELLGYLVNYCDALKSDRVKGSGAGWAHGGGAQGGGGAGRAHGGAAQGGGTGWVHGCGTQGGGAGWAHGGGPQGGDRRSTWSG